MTLLVIPLRDLARMSSGNNSLLAEVSQGGKNERKVSLFTYFCLIVRDVCSQGMVTETSFKVLKVLSFCG